MILVLDTNVIVSAILNQKGYAAEIRRAWQRGEVKVALSKPILEEVKRVLNYPRIQRRHKWSQERVAAFVKKLADTAIVTPGTKPVLGIAEDPSDDKFLSCASEANAIAIVSGDFHLLSRGFFGSCAIMTPRECAEKLKASQKAA